MKVFGFEIGRVVDEITVVDMNDLAKATKERKYYTAAEEKAKEFMIKSQHSETGVIGVEDVGFKARQQLYYSRRARLDNLYTIAFSATQIRTAVINIRNEIFRRGFEEWEPKFTKKCLNPDCSNEFEENVDECPDCKDADRLDKDGKPWGTKDPDPQQTAHFDSLREEANEFGQSMEDVLRECFDNETEILTDEGWKLFKDLNRNEKVATLASDGRIEYQRPTAYIDQPYTGRMIGGKGQGIDFLVTPRHNLFLDGKKVLARDAFGSRSQILRQGIWEGTNRSTFTIPSLDISWRCGHEGRTLRAKSWASIDVPMDDWLAFLGCFIAEGTLSSRNGVRKNIVRIQQNKSCPHFAEYEAAVNRMPFGVVERTTAWTEEGNECVCWAIHSTQLAEYLATNVGSSSHDKRIPRELFELSPAQLSVLWDYAMWGDGHAGRLYSTASKQLADDMQVVGLKIGMAGGVTHGPNTRSTIGIWTTYFKVGNRRLFIQQADWFETEHLGRVYCVTVPNHVIYVRRNGMPMWASQCEDDINIADDGFMLMVKEYIFEEGSTTGPTLERVTGLLRLDPCNIEFDLDLNGLPERAHYLCLLHREDVASGAIRREEPPFTGGQQMDNSPTGEAQSCQTCGRQMYPAMYRYLYRGRYRFYLKGEVIHWSRYAPSKTYGYSPVLSVYEKALTAIGMDRWAYDYFYERIVPPGVIVTVTDDPVGLEARIKEQELKVRENPHHIAWVAVSKKTGQGKTEYVKFGNTFTEMDFANMNQRISERISGMWGVSNIFMGTPTQIGGRDTSTSQLIVMNRVVESGQKAYNQKVMPKMVRAFGITDWVLRLNLPEEKTEMLLLEERSRKISNAAQMAAMGFNVELDDKGEFIFSGKAGAPQGQEDYGEDEGQYGVEEEGENEGGGWQTGEGEGGEEAPEEANVPPSEDEEGMPEWLREFEEEKAVELDITRI